MGNKCRSVNQKEKNIGKISTSTNEHFKGTVEFHDPLTYPQYFGFEEIIDEVTKLFENGKEPSLKRLHYVLLPGILPCIKKFNLKNFPKSPITIKNFPATPAQAAGELVDWLREELTLLIMGEKEVPNE